MRSARTCSRCVPRERARGREGQGSRRRWDRALTGAAVLRRDRGRPTGNHDRQVDQEAAQDAKGAGQVRRGAAVRGDPGELAAYVAARTWTPAAGAGTDLSPAFPTHASRCARQAMWTRLAKSTKSPQRRLEPRRPPPTLRLRLSQQRPSRLCPLQLSPSQQRPLQQSPSRQRQGTRWRLHRPCPNPRARSHLPSKPRQRKRQQPRRQQRRRRSLLLRRPRPPRALFPVMRRMVWQVRVQVTF